MQASNEYEMSFWEKNKYVIGIDEAGRGPIAGPVVVSGVVFPKNYTHDGIYDSKKVSEKKRNELFEIIKRDALFYCIVIVDAKEIDELNIYGATKKAMMDIVKQAGDRIQGALTDAMPFTIENKKIIDLVKGDQKSISIAAASILSKVTRDHIMELYDEMYPGYNFKKHKGYPTKEHCEKVELNGPCPIHRRSFEPVKSLVEPNLFTLDVE